MCLSRISVLRLRSQGVTFCGERVTSAGTLCYYTVKSTRILKNPVTHQHTDDTLSPLPGIHLTLNKCYCRLCDGNGIAFALHFLKLKSKTSPRKKRARGYSIYSDQSSVFHRNPSRHIRIYLLFKDLVEGKFHSLPHQHYGSVIFHRAKLRET